ncbi:terminase large subunit [Lentzea kentuckyensis]|uniref:terminase large subunit n=1 Tax=Lentzea kentuckyensis TaxID=360086 RepID=UPI001B80C207|nr:terminase TerL endonuclease subunit [Lentzea kentuckyensis]
MKISREVAHYMLSRGIPLPTCPPLIQTPDPGEAPDAVFDPARVDHVLTTFALLRHTQGQWAGRPLKPDSWQVAYIIAPVFGWVRWDDDAAEYVRVVRSVYVDVPRKNGKSTIGGGIALYMVGADGEPGAQVVTAATNERQAGFVFGPIKQLAESSPALKPYVHTTIKRIVHRPSASYAEVITGVGDAQHGANIHCGIVDELHVHKSPDLVEALETGTGSRRQPLLVTITTADAGKPGTIYARRRHYVEQLARRVLVDHATYGVVWAAEEHDDPHAESTWAKANPGYGVSPTRAYLQAASDKARQSPADLAAFLRLHLGVRTKQLTRFITLDAWDANGGVPVDADALAGRECYGGLDLASTSDLCALCWLFPDDENGGYDALWRLWTPDGNLPSLNKRTAGEADVWVRSGLLTVTPGNVADYDAIRVKINADRERFTVRSLGYDPWNASQLSNDLAADGAPLVKVRQGVHTLSPPLKELQRVVLAGAGGTPLLRHNGNPAVRWMVDNLAVAVDASGNVKPDKASSADKIDAVSALTIAMSEAMTRQPPRRSAYEDHDLSVI